MEKKQKKPLTEWEKGFIQGYTCAVATDIRNYGMRVEVRELWACNRHSIAKLREAGVDEQDIEILKRYWKELNR